MSELESVIRRLEELDPRIPPSRVAVIAAVLSHSGHFSVEDIIRQARAVGRATVFRTMRLLTDADIVCRVLLEAGTQCCAGPPCRRPRAGPPRAGASAKASTERCRLAGASPLGVPRPVSPATSGRPH